MLEKFIDSNHGKLRGVLYLLFLICSFGIGYYFYLLQLPIMAYSAGGDTGGYHFFANHVDLAFHDVGRTYGYPSFLYVIIQFFKIFNITVAHVSAPLLVAQFALYVFSVFFFAWTVTEKKEIQLLLVGGLLLNVLFIPFFSIMLTESLSIPLFLICYALYVRSEKNIALIFLLGLLAAFAVEVRPANIWFFSVISLLFLYRVFTSKQDKKKKVAFLLLYGIGAAIAFFPQVYANYIYFHKITPFPAMELGQLQMSLARFATRASFFVFQNEMKSFVMPNPFSPFVAHFRWISLDGFSFIILKILSMLLYDTLIEYKKLSHHGDYYVVLFSSFCVFFGFLGMYFQRYVIPKKHYAALLLGILFCFGLSFMTQFECRFVLAVFVALFPLAIYQMWMFVKERRWRFFGLFVVFFGFMNMLHIMFYALTPSFFELGIASY